MGLVTKMPVRGVKSLFEHFARPHPRFLFIYAELEFRSGFLFILAATQQKKL